jgi:hypothetical protein
MNFHSDAFLTTKPLTGLLIHQIFHQQSPPPWGYLKTIVYEIHPASAPDLTQKTWQCTKSIPNDMQKCVKTSRPSWMQSSDKGHLTVMIAVNSPLSSECIHIFYNKVHLFLQLLFHFLNIRYFCPILYNSYITHSSV